MFKVIETLVKPFVEIYDAVQDKISGGEDIVIDANEMMVHHEPEKVGDAMWYCVDIYDLNPENQDPFDTFCIVSIPNRFFTEDANTPELLAEGFHSCVRTITYGTEGDVLDSVVECDGVEGGIMVFEL